MSDTSVPTSRIVFGVVELSLVLLNFRLAGTAARMLDVGVGLGLTGSLNKQESRKVKWEKGATVPAKVFM